MKLYPYQEECIQNILSNPGKRQLITMPTGCGKTITFLAAIKAINVKTLVIAHRNELIRQTVDKALKIGFTADQIGEFSFERKDLSPPLVIGSIQTATRHLPKLIEADFQCLVIDECHHAASDSYQHLINQLKFYDDSKYLLGFTATPIRGDHLSLADTFPDEVFKMSLEHAIRSEYISDIKGIRIDLRLNLSMIRKSKGDYTVQELESEMNTLEKNSIIASTVLDKASGMKSIAFCCTVKHARDLSITLNSHNVPSEVITGDMGMDERETVYDRFRNGITKVICSCMVLTEGFDVPDVTCILMARPTQSPGLYRQMIGRGLRKHPDKKECLVIEFTSNDKRMLTLEDISPEKKIARIRDGQTLTEAIDEEILVESKRKEEVTRIYDVEYEVYDPLDRENKPIFISQSLGEGCFYVPHGDGFYYGYPDQGMIRISEFVKMDRTYELKESGWVFKSYDECLDKLQRKMKLRNIRKFYPLEGEDMTLKQKEVLDKFRVPCDGIDKREASKRIEKLFITKYLKKVK
ncbi:MAG: DEAD/DEAH box helicase [Patescibacteria group bacterium]